MLVYRPIALKFGDNVAKRYEYLSVELQENCCRGNKTMGVLAFFAKKQKHFYFILQVAD